MLVRIATPADVPLLAELYADSVHKVGLQHYRPLQVAAWAAFARDMPAFRQFILQPVTYIIEDESGIVGFAGIAEDGHIASLYVRSDRGRQGIGSLLLEALLDHAHRHQIKRLYAEANEFSRSLFARFKFRQYDTEVVQRGEAQFTRYLMERVDGAEA